MSKKSSSNPFNAAAPKDSDLLAKILFARKMVEVAPTLLESLPALREARHACEILARRAGVAYTPVDMEAEIAKDKATYAKPDKALAERSELYSEKKASEVFGLLSALIKTNAAGIFVLARMDNKHRLKICQDAEKTLAWSIVMSLRAHRYKEPKKVPSVKR